MFCILLRRIGTILIKLLLLSLELGSSPQLPPCDHDLVNITALNLFSSHSSSSSTYPVFSLSSHLHSLLLALVSVPILRRRTSTHITGGMESAARSLLHISTDCSAATTSHLPSLPWYRPCIRRLESGLQKRKVKKKNKQML